MTIRFYISNLNGNSRCIPTVPANLVSNVGAGVPHTTGLPNSVDAPEGSMGKIPIGRGPSSAWRGGAHRLAESSLFWEPQGHHQASCARPRCGSSQQRDRLGPRGQLRLNVWHRQSNDDGGGRFRTTRPCSEPGPVGAGQLPGVPVRSAPICFTAVQLTYPRTA